MTSQDQEYLFFKVCLPAWNHFIWLVSCVWRVTQWAQTVCYTVQECVQSTELTQSTSIDHSSPCRYQEFQHLTNKVTKCLWLLTVRWICIVCIFYHQPYCVWSRPVCRQQNTSHCRSSWALNPYIESSVLPLPSGTKRTLSAHSVHRPLQGKSRKKVWGYTVSAESTCR